MTAQLKWRYENLTKVPKDFGLPNGRALCLTKVDNVKEDACDFALDYTSGMDAKEVEGKIACFKFQACLLLADKECYSCWVS